MSFIEIYVDVRRDALGEIESVTKENGVSVIYLYPRWHRYARKNYIDLKSVIGVEEDYPILRNTSSGEVVVGIKMIKLYLQEYGKRTN